MNDEIKILLADDHEILRGGVRRILELHPDLAVIGEAATAQDAITATTLLCPDVVLLDLSMEARLSGLRAAQEIRSKYDHIRILALTFYDDAGTVEQAFSAGVHGYLLKNSAAEKLADAIRTVVANGIYIDSAVCRYLVAGAVRHLGSDPIPVPAALSPRETEVLREYAIGYTVKEIAAALQCSTKSVETYRMRGMKKLGLRSRVDVMRAAIERQWLDSLTENTN